MEVVAKKITLYKKEHDESKGQYQNQDKFTYEGESTFLDKLERTQDPDDENGLEAAEQLSEILNGPMGQQSGLDADADFKNSLYMETTRMPSTLIPNISSGN